jgi:hypothetical protein
MEGGTFTQVSVGPHVPSVAGVKIEPRTGSWDSEDNKNEVAMSTKPVVDKDFLCPICIQTMKDAFLTACGHSFCYMCIITHLSNKSNCPSCGLYLTNNQLFPNFLLNKVSALLPMYYHLFHSLCCSVSNRELNRTFRRLMLVQWHGMVQVYEGHVILQIDDIDMTVTSQA